MTDKQSSVCSATLIITFLCFVFVFFSSPWTSFHRLHIKGPGDISMLVESRRFPQPVRPWSSQSLLPKEGVSMMAYFNFKFNFACVWVQLPGDSYFILCLLFVFLHCVLPTARPPATGKSVQSISIQIGSAISTPTTHPSGSPTACSSAAKTTSPIPMTNVSLWRILVSNKHLCIYPDFFNVSDELGEFCVAIWHCETCSRTCFFHIKE